VNGKVCVVELISVPPAVIVTSMIDAVEITFHDSVEPVSDLKNDEPGAGGGGVFVHVIELGAPVTLM
jgi:hypothetical protein